MQTKDGITQKDIDEVRVEAKKSIEALREKMKKENCTLCGVLEYIEFLKVKEHHSLCDNCSSRMGA